ncbi:MAG: HEAT repeat domain-containing protein [Pirellulales bacterium]
MADKPSRQLSADDMLPPVEPPSAAFLVQLFLVPGLIVAIIVCVWLAFHWLAHLGNDPQAYVRTLRRANEGRWQAALNLANDIRGPRGATLKHDTALATELGRILSDEVASGRTGEQSEMLELYLCRALGEFAIPEAAAPLVAQARDGSSPTRARAAVEALAVLAANLSPTGVDWDEAAAAEAVISASRSSDRQLASAAAFTLGVVGGPGAAERLLELQSQADDDIRFNAAVGLARLGRAEAFPTLSDMLALPDVAAAADDPQAQSARYKRALVVVNALRATALLVDAGTDETPAEVVRRVTSLVNDPVSDVQTAAAALVRKFRRVGPEAAN